MIEKTVIKSKRPGPNHQPSRMRKNPDSSH